MQKLNFIEDSVVDRHYIFIINPISGTKKIKNINELINRKFAKESFEIYTTEYQNHATVISSQYSDQPNVVLVSVGGDGTLNEIAQSLINKEAKLGIIPNGSGNGFAGHLFVDKNIHHCLERLKNNRYALVDVLLINDKICCNTIGIGLSGYVAKIFNQNGKRGLYQYMKLGLGKFSEFKSFGIQIDGQEFNSNISVEIANSSQLGNNAYISPDSLIQDGIAEIILLTKPKAYQIPGLIYDVFNRRLNSNKLTQNFISSDSLLKLKDENYYHIDGDYKGMSAEFEFKVLKSVLKIVV
ncbi:MAG: diacylglycerol kinase family protein [Saprospiraceae bacterium]